MIARLTVLAALVALVTAQPVAAQSLTKVHAIGKTDKIATYADSATLRREGGVVTLWLLSAYRPEAEPQPGIRFIEARERYDCTARTKTVLTIRAVRSDGSIVVDFTFENPQAEPFNPDGVFGLSARLFCEPGSLEAQPVIADYRRDALEKLGIN